MKNHPEEEQAQQKSDAAGKSGQRRNRKKLQAVAAAAVTLLLLVAIPVMAWLYERRSIETLALVQEPNALLIGEGDQQKIQELNLNNIDVAGDAKSKDVVFCVFSLSKINYKLQLAHTTNIGFTYTIYPVTKVSSGTTEGETVQDNAGNKYQFQVDSTGKKKLAGKYLNQDITDSKERLKASNTYHGITYPAESGTGSYSNVQTYAEPLYWQSTDPSLTLETKAESGYYVDYYVLHVSWENIQDIANNKETDMIYLMADKNTSASGSEGN